MACRDCYGMPMMMPLPGPQCCAEEQPITFFTICQYVAIIFVILVVILGAYDYLKPKPPKCCYRPSNSYCICKKTC
ncbi:hypothetical protein SNEBB_008498 [Seison nebaliae]|nr:hypothetical protein SNEBB_008498 [Seison nebaliae]